MKNLIKKNQLMITALAIMIAIAGYLQFAGTGLEEEYLSTEGGAGTAGASTVDSGGVITENYTAGGLLDLSEEDLMTGTLTEMEGLTGTEGLTQMEGLTGTEGLTQMEGLTGTEGLTEIESLDSEDDIIVDDYLEDGMIVAGANASAAGQLAEATPDENEIPGEAVFTSTSGVTILSDAKLLKEQTRARNKETLLDIIESEGLTDTQKQEAVDTMVAMTAIAEKEAAAEILLEAKGFKDVVVSINGNAVDVVVNATELDDAMRAQIEDIVKRKTEIPAENIIISTVVQ